jgi:hypothetical protein
MVATTIETCNVEDVEGVMVAVVVAAAEEGEVVEMEMVAEEARAAAAVVVAHSSCSIRIWDSLSTSLVSLMNRTEKSHARLISALLLALSVMSVFTRITIRCG